jgi:hypothetical protein
MTHVSNSVTLSPANLLPPRRPGSGNRSHARPRRARADAERQSCRAVVRTRRRTFKTATRAVPCELADAGPAGCPAAYPRRQRRSTPDSRTSPARSYGASVSSRTTVRGPRPATPAAATSARSAVSGGPSPSPTGPGY